MAHREALKEISGTGERKENTQPGISPQQQTGRAVFRAGCWYAGDVRCASYREALKRTLAAAGFRDEKPPKPARPKPNRYLRPERLETRAWWDDFLDARALREAQRIAEEQAARDAEAERIWAAVKAGTGEKVVVHNNFPAGLTRGAGA